MLLFDALDRQLQREIGHAARLTTRSSSGCPRRTAAACGMSELADAHAFPRAAALSHAVARLEERGWLKRVECEDRQAGPGSRCSPDVGFAALEEAAPGHVAAVRKHLIDQLTPETDRPSSNRSVSVVVGRAWNHRSARPVRAADTPA